MQGIGVKLCTHREVVDARKLEQGEWKMVESGSYTHSESQ